MRLSFHLGWICAVLALLFVQPGPLLSAEGVATVDPPEPQLGAIKVNPQDGAVMVYVPAGEFEAGPPVGMSSKHTKKLYLTGFWIYKTEVTVAQYKKFCQQTKRPLPTGASNNPITNVNWADATAYAEWAGAKLPTEAQWEKAARGVDGRRYPWGNDWDATKCANSVENTLQVPKAVGSYPTGVSPYGVLDMIGNVQEWCVDWDAEEYYPLQSQVVDPTGPPEGTKRVLRGGAWTSSITMDLRATSRNSGDPKVGWEDIGFRCVIPGKAKPAQ